MESLHTYGELQDLENSEYKLHPLANMSQGGIELRDEENIVRGAFKEIVAKVMKKALKGQLADVMTTPAPAQIHDIQSSHLNLQQREMTFCPNLMKAANESDPVERMKWIIAYYVGGNYVNQTIMQSRIPINPILGETLQREMVTGEKLYCEQVSHHPPITAYTLYGPDEAYVLTGFHTLKAWLDSAQSMGGSKIGQATLTFKDGSVYKLTNPNLSVEGLYSTMTLVYYQYGRIRDVNNGILGEIHYNPSFDPSYYGMASRYTAGWFKSTLGTNEKAGRPARADDIDVVIKKLKDPENEESFDGETICEGQGSWLSHLLIDDKQYWRIEDEAPNWIGNPLNNEKPSDGSILLESDSQNRADVKLMVQKEWEEAEKAKVVLEELQRKDKRLRIAAKEKQQ